MTRLDFSDAWASARQLVAANREVLLIVAGVFFLLPLIAFNLIVPQPELPAGIPREETMRRLSEFYTAALPWLLAMTALQTIGLLTLIRLMGDPARPTVAEALKSGAIGTPILLVAQLMIGAIWGIGALLLGTMGAVAGPVGVTVALAVAVAILLALVTRFVLASCAIVLEGVRNPMAALVRSWRVTQGNGGQMLAFYALLVIAATVIGGVAMLLVGIVLAVLTQGQLQSALADLAYGALATVISLYLAAVTAAVWRQLTGK